MVEFRYRSEHSGGNGAPGPPPRLSRLAPIRRVELVCFFRDSFLPALAAVGAKLVRLRCSMSSVCDDDLCSVACAASRPLFLLWNVAEMLLICEGNC